MADREQVEPYDAQVQELRGQVKFLEEEVGLLRRRLSSSPRQVAVLDWTDRHPRAALWSELCGWLLLAGILLAVYLTWVLGTAWIVLQDVAPEGVPTPAWIATIACATVVGYGGSLLWQRLGGASRYTPLWWVVAPVVIEVVAFSVVSFAS